MLPASFPENFVFRFTLDPQNAKDKGKKAKYETAARAASCTEATSVSNAR